MSSRREGAPPGTGDVVCRGGGGLVGKVRSIWMWMAEELKRVGREGADEGPERWKPRVPQINKDGRAGTGRMTVYLARRKYGRQARLSWMA